MPRFSVITPTHNLRWIDQTWASLRNQTFIDFEWVVMVNERNGSRSDCERMVQALKKIVGDDKRVRIVVDTNKFIGVGATKKRAFSKGVGDILVELDHDDLLLPLALEELSRAFEDESVGFVYSDFADFDDSAKEGQGSPSTYIADGARRMAWMETGYDFYHRELDGVRPGSYECVRALPATGANVSNIYTAPNHVRAWRRRVYELVGGHQDGLKVADDAELMIRTYMVTFFHHIAEPLYLYRISNSNTWSNSAGVIKAISTDLMLTNMEKLVLRWCEIEGLKAYSYDVEGPRLGWLSDAENFLDVPDGTAGAIRASDHLCRHVDKEGMMNDLWRMLSNGGILMTDTPSTDGRGAFQDPGHKSFWNENSFWYWTKSYYRKFLANPNVLFRPMYVATYFPSVWHETNHIPYVRAWLVAVKE